MEQIIVALKQCNLGVILSRDVINEGGTVLVTKDTQINEFIKEKLLELGQSEVFIYKHHNEDQADNVVENHADNFSENHADNFTEDDSYIKVRQNYSAAIIDLKRMIGSLSAGENINYKEILVLSQLVTNQIDESNSIIKYLSKVKDYDDYTYTHSLNTAFYCMLISKWMKMSEKKVNIAIQAGLMHDIGKIDVPKDILNKKGILTADEFDIIKKHTIYGYKKLESFEGSHLIPEEVKKSILLHHERIDGSGYPYSTTAEKICIFAKIVSVADVFDAMTSDRVYKQRTSPFEVFEMFRTVGIGMFDTDIINIFIKNIAHNYIDSKVLLSDGSVGKIVYVPPHDVSRPIVKVDSKYLDLTREDDIKILRIV